MSSTSSSAPGPDPPDSAVLATLGAATRPDDGDPLDWVRRAHEPAGRHRASRHRPHLVTVPSQLADGRRRVSRRAVLGVLALVLLVVLIGGVRVARAVQDARPEVIASQTTAPRATDSSALEQGQLSAEAEASSSPTQSAVIVHVAGAVKEPGIVELRPGDRVVDALRAAGGATSKADLGALNLARPVTDGEQVYVPLPGESPPAPAAVAGSSGGGGGVGSDGVVDLNTADAQALDSLPGVGPVLAERILDWRLEHGRFTSVDELAEVSGIGDKLLSQIREKVRVGP